jgi:hypothetical protein
LYNVSKKNVRLTKTVEKWESKEMNRLQRIADGNTERMVGKRRGMVMQKPSQKPCKHNIRQRLMEMDGDKSG